MYFLKTFMHLRAVLYDHYIVQYYMLDFRRFLSTPREEAVRGTSVGSFPEQELVTEPMLNQN